MGILRAEAEREEADSTAAAASARAVTQRAVSDCSGENSGRAGVGSNSSSNRNSNSSIFSGSYSHTDQRGKARILLAVRAKLRLRRADGSLVSPQPSGSQGEVIIATQALDAGRVLRILPCTNAAALALSGSTGCTGFGGAIVGSVSVAAETGTSASYSTVPYRYAISLHIAAIGASLILERPIRREFLSIYIDNFSGVTAVAGTTSSVEVKIDDLQVDNYSETALYPVMIHSGDKRRMGKERAMRGKEAAAAAAAAAAVTVTESARTHTPISLKSPLNENVEGVAGEGREKCPVDVSRGVNTIGGT